MAMGLLLLTITAALQCACTLPTFQYTKDLKSTNCSSLDADVLVLGAGMARISAAMTLSQEYNITKCLILEGMDDIGGRVRSVPFGGVNVELGANWIEGVLGGSKTKVNPLWLLKEKYNLQGQLSNYCESCGRSEHPARGRSGGRVCSCSPSTGGLGAEQCH